MDPEKIFRACDCGVSGNCPDVARHVRGGRLRHRKGVVKEAGFVQVHDDDKPVLPAPFFLPDAATIRTVAEHLPPEIALVLDPVMIATSGKRLSSPEGRAALSDLLIPRAQLVTPNIPELCALTGRATITTTAEMTAAGRELLAMGAAAVLIKGGHLIADRSPDVYISQDETAILDGPRYPWEVHGSGCCLAAAITAYLVRGDTLPEACRRGKAFAADAIRTAVPAISGRRMVNPGGMVSGTHNSGAGNKNRK